jgi:guanosine-3',5'-bis(diphosphate) 3'-pyrophosphohydrolase
MEFTEEDNNLIDSKWEELRLAALKRCASQEEYETVIRAFNFAREAHKGVRRKSGEPYIIHPIAVALIVVKEIGLGYKSICAALMHDVVEDTDYTVDDIRRLFGDKIAELVDGLTKIKSALHNDANMDEKSLQAENFKRILLTMNDDVRIVLIKLADRLHNVRTIQYMPEHKRDKILSETMYIFIPLALRLGLYSIKSEMENIWLQYKEPQAYAEIRERLNRVMLEQGESIDKFIAPISEKLDNAGFKFQIIKRMKTPYSIWAKMNVKGIPFDEIYDLYAVRIIFTPMEDTSEREQCWRIFSMVTDLYHCKTERTRDWVNYPKSNGYEALHCTVMSQGGYWVEVQIRSERMNLIAEKGIAAHWAYKKKYNIQEDENEVDLWLKKVRDVLESPDANALNFLDDFHKELVTSEIYIYTPKGESKTMPKGATALDFAYTVHSHIGDKAIAAKVNQKLVPLSYELQNGDQIEIITAENSKPKREWLDFLKTSKARSEVIDALKNDTKNNIAEGMSILSAKLAENGIKPSKRTITKLMDYYQLTGGKDDLYNKIGMGIIDLSDLHDVLKTNSQKKNVEMWGVSAIADPNQKDGYVLSENPKDMSLSFKIADCCNPIPGDSVMGFLGDDKKVIIHKKSCMVAQNLASVQGDRIIAVKWSKFNVQSFLARISLRGIDRIGMLNEITKHISLELSVNIRKLFIQSHDGIFEGYIDLYVKDTEVLNSLIAKLSSIKGMENVNRVEISGNNKTEDTEE